MKERAMDATTFVELRKAAIALTHADLRIGSIDSTTEKNARRIKLAERLVMKALQDELKGNPDFIRLKTS